MNQILQYKKLKQEKRIRYLVIQGQSCPGILGHTVLLRLKEGVPSSQVL